MSADVNAATNAALNAVANTSAGWDARALADAWLTVTAFGPQTAGNYRRDSGLWLSHCRRHGVPWNRSSPTHVALWAHRRGSAHRFAMQRVSALRSFYAYALRQGAVVHNPADSGSHSLPLGPVAPGRLDARQTVALFSTLDGWDRGRSDDPGRDRACGYLLVGLGLLSRQLVTLTLDDVDTTAREGAPAGTLRVRGNADGSDIRTVPVPELVGQVLADYLPSRVVRPGTPVPGPLFTGRAGKRMPSHYPNALLRSVAAAAL